MGRFINLILSDVDQSYIGAFSVELARQYRRVDQEARRHPEPGVAKDTCFVSTIVLVYCAGPVLVCESSNQATESCRNWCASTDTVVTLLFTATSKLEMRQHLQPDRVRLVHQKVSLACCAVLPSTTLAPSLPDLACDLLLEDIRIQVPSSLVPEPPTDSVPRHLAVLL